VKVMQVNFVRFFVSEVSFVSLLSSSSFPATTGRNASYPSQKKKRVILPIGESAR